MLPVLVVNAGSTSLKLELVSANDQSETLALMDEAKGRAAAIGHRVVHGGKRFREPVVLDSDVIAEIEAMSEVAPLHNRPALEAIAKARKLFGAEPQVAVFDTAFHSTIPDEASTYAVPRSWRERYGIRRYGFHGLSVAWAAERAPELLGRPVERLVVCHLGGGCSITAVRAGQSIDTSMGFSPLEGVPMTTRSGSIDPGALFYLMAPDRLSHERIERALENDSGLKGLSGTSGDMRELEQAEDAGDKRAALALSVYVHRIAATIGAMAVSLGGLDAIVFTAGVGENSARVRARVCERLSFLDVEIDPKLNSRAVPDLDVARNSSAVRVLVVRAREALVVARAVRQVLMAGS
ncbi:MAG: acetate/propionate family kinase [Gaiellaceae bacterium]|jgi:acetate kinase